LLDMMLAAGQCETWLTLHELARLTGYGEASISAQLRHLRKVRYGGFLVHKRVRAAGAVIRGELGPLWEYQLRRAVRRIWLVAQTRNSRSQRRRPAPRKKVRKETSR
jgi:hypothetical protein